MGKSLVTGGAGLIGSHLVKALLDEGREVVIVDDLSRGRRETLLRLGVRVAPIRLDLRDYRQVLQHMDGIEAVFHLAARVGSVESLHSTNMGELLSLQTNLVIDANVFRAALHAGVRKLVYASSVSVYPMELQRSHGAVLKEDDLRFASPEGGYGWAKLMGETQLQLVTGMAVGIARLFNIYGECAEPEEDALVVPALVRKAVLFPQEEFRVWGDGSQTRDLLHAADAVEALIKLEEKASTPPVIVNIGSGEPMPVSVLTEKVVRHSGKDINPIYDPAMPVGAVARVADISRARAILGWNPKVSLDEGLERMFAHMASPQSASEIVP